MKFFDQTFCNLIEPLNSLKRIPTKSKKYFKIVNNSKLLTIQNYFKIKDKFTRTVFGGSNKKNCAFIFNDFLFAIQIFLQTNNILYFIIIF